MSRRRKTSRKLAKRLRKITNVQKKKKVYEGRTEVGKSEMSKEKKDV
jgi:hypothetical protein